MTDRFDLIIFKSYKWQGKKRYKPYFAGEAWASRKNGDFVLNIPEGISLSGRVVMTPATDRRLSEEEIASQYSCLADELGL